MIEAILQNKDFTVNKKCKIPSNFRLITFNNKFYVRVLVLQDHTVYIESDEFKLNDIDFDDRSHFSKRIQNGGW